MTITFAQIKPLILTIAIVLGCAAQSDAQPRLRVHTATEAAPLSLAPATRAIDAQTVQIEVSGAWRVIRSNGVPTHPVGVFPNSGNPNRLSGQSHVFHVPLTPQVVAATPLARGGAFGVAVNGVPFDPNAAEFWQGQPRSGWDYAALGGAVSLGLDANFGHVQATGAYHYHGLPVGLMQELGWTRTGPSPLLGYAADGFPIYALTAEVDGVVQPMTSSYQLRRGERPGGDAPGGNFDGAFHQDYAYVAGAGTLDACNGTFVTNDAYPDGTYAYVLTQGYPVVPRCLMGVAGRGFAKR
ncbi:YHYH protein [uncultured Tateyamaria sp.]|uniref:YHYH protein n=1 Tax=uncultured Tateyamaria sp. TaxID=455651 RepID=UPI00261B493A|nr:YHYH protein [uncultured Tateyamaria sp.]